jgi:type IV pilus assembly protein PilM
MDFSRAFARHFPVPQMLMPRAVGVDITDASIKWMMLTQHKGNTRVATYGQQALSPGIVEHETVKDPHALAEALKSIKKRLGTSYVHAALPEEGAYVFSMHVPLGISREEVLHMVEFELEGRVPIPVPQAVYDYDIVAEHDEETGMEIAVVAFPRELAEGYVAAFAHAGLSLMSLELEARSIGRAVTSTTGDDPITLLADTGKERTGFAILKHGVPIFTSTVAVGGAQMTKVVMEGLSVDENAAQTFKNEEGLLASDPKTAAVRTALEKVAGGLADEVARHYHFWDTRRNEHGERVTPVGQVYLVGGSANLRGLPDYIAGKIQAPTERPNVWRNVASFEEYIPQIDRRMSLQFATAIGLALRSL